MFGKILSTDVCNAIESLDVNKLDGLLKESEIDFDALRNASEFQELVNELRLNALSQNITQEKKTLGNGLHSKILQVLLKYKIISKRTKPVHQNRAISFLAKYLDKRYLGRPEEKSRIKEDYIERHREGLCYGLSALWGGYYSFLEEAGDMDEGAFFDFMENIDELMEKVDFKSLQSKVYNSENINKKLYEEKKLPLPEGLNASEMEIEQFFNDTAFLFGAFDTELEQKNILKKLKLVSKHPTIQKLSSQLSVYSNFDEKSLKKFLEEVLLADADKSKFIFIGAGKHQMACFYHGDGCCKFYDPNVDLEPISVNLKKDSKKGIETLRKHLSLSQRIYNKNFYDSNASFVSFEVISPEDLSELKEKKEKLFKTFISEIKNPERVLLEAIQHENEEEASIYALLENPNLNPNAFFLDIEKSLLDLAVEERNFKLVKKLVEHPKFDAKLEKGAMAIAYEKDAKQIYKYLSEQGLSLDKPSLLKSAVIRKDIDLVKLLLLDLKEKNPDILGRAVRDDSLEIVDLLVQNRFPVEESFVLSAIENENIKILELIAKHAKEKSQTSFYVAVNSKKKEEMLEILIKSGFPSSERFLFWAVLDENMKLFDLLIKVTKIESSDCLHKAIEKNNLEMIKLLIENNSPIDFQSVHIAVQARNAKALEILLETGKVDFNNRRARVYCNLIKKEIQELDKDHEIVKLLKKYGVLSE